MRRCGEMTENDVLSKVGKVHREYNVSCRGGSGQVCWVLNTKTLSGFAKALWFPQVPEKCL